MSLRPTRVALIIGFDSETKVKIPSSLEFDSMVEVPAPSSGTEWSRLRSVPVDAATWRAAMKELEEGLDRALEANREELHVFTMAPYSAVAYLGRRLDERARTQLYCVHQFMSGSGQWESFSRSGTTGSTETETYFAPLPVVEKGAPAVLLAIDPMRGIADETRVRLAERIGAISYHLHSQRSEPIGSAETATAVGELRRVITDLGRQHPAASLHVVTTAPVALVFEFGRLVNPTSFGSVVVYHYDGSSTSHVPVLDIVRREVMEEQNSRPTTKSLASSITLHVKNFYALRDVRWSPSETCAIVGANGAGKTTLLLALKLVRAAVSRGLPQAVASVLGGGHGLRYWGAPDDEAVELGLDVAGLSWRVSLVPRGATVDYLTNEVLRSRGEVIFSKDGLGNFLHRGKRRDSDERVGLRAIGDDPTPDPAVETMLACIRSISVYHDPDLWSLRQQGSHKAQHRRLFSRSENTFAVLHEWSRAPKYQARFRLVRDGLRAAFPTLCEDLEFEEAGDTVTVWVFAPGRERPSPIRNAANGLLSMLVLLCNVVSEDTGGLIAIDEPENGLHPYAIREFLRRASSWARLHDLAIVFTTHSPVLLDQLEAESSLVFVMRADGCGPIPIYEHRDREWLANFRLGELYADGELGSNDDGAE